MIRVNICPICGGKSLSKLKQYTFQSPKYQNQTDLPLDIDYFTERLWIFFKKILKEEDTARIDVLLCNSCGFIFTNPRFTTEEIKTKYSSIAQLPSAKLRQQQQPPLRINERAERIYYLLKGLQKDECNKLKILDYGGATGNNLIPFIKKGYQSYLIDYVQLKIPKKVKYLGPNLDILKENDKFDIILLCHTLEHLIEPQKFVNELSSYLSETGVLYIEVPLGCWQEWRYLKEPLSHINFFSEESIYRCLHKVQLKTLHLSTSYQWVLHRKTWCINTVGTKRKLKPISNYKSTLQQMKSPLYHIKTILDDIRQFFYQPKKGLLEILSLIKNFLV